MNRDGWWRSIPAGVMMTIALSGCITVGPVGTAPRSAGPTGQPSLSSSPKPSAAASLTATPPAPTATSTAVPTPTTMPTGTAVPTPTASPSAIVSAGASAGPSAPGPTSSPSPSATPASDGFGAITPIFQDDFTDTPSGWGIGEEDDGAIDYGDGHLRVDLTMPTAGLWSTRLLDGSWEVVQIEGTVQPLAGPASQAGYAGFLCAAGQRDYFMGLIDTRGGWVFAEAVDTAVAVLERGGPPPPAVSAGLGTRLTMQCAGSETGAVRLRLLVDGEEAGRFERDDGLARFDQVGVYGEAVDPTFSFTVDGVDVRGGAVFVDPPRPLPQP